MRVTVQHHVVSGHLLLAQEVWIVHDQHAPLAERERERRLLEAHTGGTLVLRANPIVCRALKETGTLTAFALWTGPGM